MWTSAGTTRAWHRSSLISDSAVGHHLFADDIESIVHLLPGTWILCQYSTPTKYNWSRLSMDVCCNVLSLNQSKTEFLLKGLPAQLSKVSDPSLLMPSNVTITPAQSAWRYIWFYTLDVWSLLSSKSCFLSIRDLRRIRNTLDFSTARTIATSLIHAKLDYCNSLLINLPQSQLGRF